MAEERQASRTAFLWAGGVMTVVVVATVTAFVIIVLLGDDDDTTPPAEAVGNDPPTVTSSLPLRSGPAGDTAINGNLQAGTEIRVIGRNETGDWLFIEVAGPPTVRGWVEAGDVEPPPDVAALAVSTPEPAPGETATVAPTAVATPPTFTPDLPDLAVQSVFSRDNRVVIVVTNVGVTDVTEPIVVSLDGGTPREADVKPGEPLRPDDRFEITLEDEYVQRRALVRATVSTDPPIEENNTENNSLETVISPDIPNDLGIASAAFDGPDGALRVVLVNNSTIPVTGSATLIVREAGDQRTRLGTEQPVFTLEAGATLDVDFPEIVELTIDDVTIRLSSDAVNDSDQTNDVFPR